MMPTTTRIYDILSKHSSERASTMSDSCFVYIDRKPCGEPFYVGIGDKSRVAYTKRNNLHTKIAKKYPGWTRTILCQGTRDYCVDTEAKAIATFGRINTNTGTLANLTDGGERGIIGLVHSEESRRKMSAWQIGTTQTQESNEKRRKALSGRPKSERHVERIVAARHRGKSAAELQEINRKISAAHAKQSVRDGKSKLFSTLVWITDGATSKRVKRDHQIPEGWRLGRSRFEYDREARAAKISASLTGHKYAPEHNAANSKRQTARFARVRAFVEGSGYSGNRRLITDAMISEWEQNNHG